MTQLMKRPSAGIDSTTTPDLDRWSAIAKDFLSNMAFTSAPDLVQVSPVLLHVNGNF